MAADLNRGVAWLFGSEWTFESYTKGTRKYILVTGDNSEYESDKACDNAAICRLIDETLMEHEDVGGTVAYQSESHGHHFVIRDGNEDDTDNQGDSHDPLTARLIAVHMLKQELDVPGKEGE